MKGRKYFKKVFVIGAFCLLMLPSLHGAFGDSPISEKNDYDEEYSDNPGVTISYSNCVVWIFGKCNLAGGALTWIFGLYCPLSKKHIWVAATGQEDEALNVIITGDEMGAYYNFENIFIDLWGATGILFWGKKSILLGGNMILMRVKADIAYVTT